MKIRASIESLNWEDTFLSANSTIAHFDQHALVLTVDVLQLWSWVQAKVPAANTHELDALRQLGLSPAEGEVNSVSPMMCTHGDPGVQVTQTTDIPALR